MKHYQNQISYTKNLRDLNNFAPLMTFYKSFYKKELETVIVSQGKKLPGQKKEFVLEARQQKLDEFARKCMLGPLQLVENIQNEEGRQIHKPN